MVTTTEILRYTAFAETPQGGNPAGVVLDASKLTDAEMQEIAAEVGYSETAFVLSTPAAHEQKTPGDETTRHSYNVRYWSPAAEVPFCGHATVATAVVLAERDGIGSFAFHTFAGDIQIVTSRSATGQVEVAMTSVEPCIRDFDPDTLGSLLKLLGLEASDLDTRFPPREAFAGNWHPILVLSDADIFNQFRFSPPAVAALMKSQGWSGTVTVLHESAPAEFQARNLFPVGRITEDPATGSAAASTGAYLRSIGYASAESRITIHQGQHVGRPSILTAVVPEHGGITVLGSATPIKD
ncbi:PhzF family phenazine biosynthesis protein [Bifidobacterium crudilactis]|jgi:PhzF family phenazine biosynthesis protein|uniref:PhzF family phenazine biosynthesis protein n=1 Tax=Bifidobacterium crudilactis TaxID=327277 RepID=A0A971IC17_9BIFI|nr:PhzF family phenazine biosynthesis protein [Bifidobacterium crudilactis]MCI1869278.1 PhzF family phenazine biosynthesis protein [Bifidobacterium crudilactis]MDN5972489.1 PhzF family phenazine biosynthesis protein [Bifidobacterium crudilactis]MDN6000934.1 PhzF family phenazine biosynthesis protein [Bifidobacterium crudilactis]MDN6209912.1 PhzF family phenazine biosynthesis protein [Bifidobacterium crudilactis]MDN6271814.1 PhzF family phenazine biosynthesis protein [Bifidobacterium crudilacti